MPALWQIIILLSSSGMSIMNIKQYIDYFKEISHLERSIQFKLIEQAQNDIQNKYKFPILDFISFFVRLVCISLFVGGTYFGLGFSSWGLVFPLLLSLLCSRVVTTELTDSIILKALKNNINRL